MPQMQAAAPQKQLEMDTTKQVAEMTKWAEMMGMPKMNNEDMSKILNMQKAMMSKLQSLPQNEISLMRQEQNQLAEQMDSLLGNMSDGGVESFQNKQEQLMNSWASKLGLP